MIGGLTGGRQASSTEPNAATDLREGETRARLEGASARPAESRSRLKLDNIVQCTGHRAELHQARRDPEARRPGQRAVQPVTDELTTRPPRPEVDRPRHRAKTSFNGVYNKPTDNTTAPRPAVWSPRSAPGSTAPTTHAPTPARRPSPRWRSPPPTDCFTVTHALNNGDAVIVTDGAAVGFSPRACTSGQQVATVSFKLAREPRGCRDHPDRGRHGHGDRDRRHQRRDDPRPAQQIWENAACVRRDGNRAGRLHGEAGPDPRVHHRRRLPGTPATSAA